MDENVKIRKVIDSALVLYYKYLIDQKSKNEDIKLTEVDFILNELIRNNIGDISIWQNQVKTEHSMQELAKSFHDEKCLEYDLLNAKYQKLQVESELNNKVKDIALDKAINLAFEYRTTLDTLSCSSCPFESAFDQCKRKGLYLSCVDTWKEEILKEAKSEVIKGDTSNE